MVNWVLTAGLQNLRRQVNDRWPKRDKASDGTIGDYAHTQEHSGHNPDDTSQHNAEWDGDPDSTPEVRAWDMDDDLGESGSTAQMVVDHIRALPNVSSVLRYIIYNRKIYRSTAGFAPAAYTGASPHTEHIHFSGAYSQASDNNTSFDFKLEEVGDMADVKAECYAALKQFVADGYEAAQGRAGGSSAADKGKRQIRDYVRAITGGPVNEIALLSAIASVADVDEATLAGALVGPLSAAILTNLPDGALTQADVEAAVRNVLQTGVDAGA